MDSPKSCPLHEVSSSQETVRLTLRDQIEEFCAGRGVWGSGSLVDSVLIHNSATKILQYNDPALGARVLRSRKPRKCKLPAPQCSATEDSLHVVQLSEHAFLVAEFRLAFPLHSVTSRSRTFEACTVLAGRGWLLQVGIKIANPRILQNRIMEACCEPCCVFALLCYAKKSAPLLFLSLRLTTALFGHSVGENSPDLRRQWTHQAHQREAPFPSRSAWPYTSLLMHADVMLMRLPLFAACAFLQGPTLFSML